MPKVPIKKEISLLKHFHEKKKNNVHNDFGEKKASEGPLGVWVGLQIGANAET